MGRQYCNIIDIMGQVFVVHVRCIRSATSTKTGRVATADRMFPASGTRQTRSGSLDDYQLRFAHCTCQSTSLHRVPSLSGSAQKGNRPIGHSRPYPHPTLGINLKMPRTSPKNLQKMIKLLMFRNGAVLHVRIELQAWSEGCRTYNRTPGVTGAAYKEI